MVATVESYNFTPLDLRIAERKPGVSAFMRIRNGAFALEQTIRSHIDCFDEIVAVYNRCTDDTPAILAHLEAEFGPKLRVFSYIPDVYPPGSEGHAKLPPDAPASFVNYSNFALSQTRYSHATKLDDDHIAFPAATRHLVQDARTSSDMLCFSGLNLAHGPRGMLGILLRDPFSGSGDIGVFQVTQETYFTHDPRFEMFRPRGLRRRFHSFTYWHVKYLKPGRGFDNYDLKDNPKSRYGRKFRRHLAADPSVADLVGFKQLHEPRRLSRLSWAGFPVPERDRIMADRDLHVALLPNLELPTLSANV